MRIRWHWPTLVVLAWGCSDPSHDTVRDPSSVGAADAQVPATGWDLTVPCDDLEARLDEPPSAAELAQPQGSILRCVSGPVLEASELDALARSTGYEGPELESAAALLRVVFRTERGSEPARPGFSGATVLLPTSPRAEQLPVLVVAHGTVGEAPHCVPSREDPSEPGTYLAKLGYALAGAGYAVLLPDYAGYAAFGAAGNPPAGYHSAADEGKSVLDGARALRTLVPSAFDDELVLVGHSQGGHAVLSALALHEQYGSGSTLRGVVAYAPSWFPLTSFGGMIARAHTYTLPESSGIVAASVWYHYSHAELLDGEGQGPLLFAESKREALRTFFRGSCDSRDLAKVGPDIGTLFDQGFADDVALFAGTGVACTSERCKTWMARYTADRPHLTGAALSVPILLVQGDDDSWIPPERVTCGFDRLESDGADLSVCIVAGATHGGVVDKRAAYVNEWIAARTLAGREPGKCGADRSALHDASGQPATCATVPPND